MVSFPNAKINLGLNILRKRNDGYHEISSVMLPLGNILYDTLEILPGKRRNSKNKVRFFSYGDRIPGTPAGNLCMKAYELLDELYDLPPADIHLLKCIPTGAGLGGGSADGAFAMKLIHEEFKLKLSAKQLEQLAARLGSDCPFFIRNQPAWVQGRGEKITPVRIHPELNGKYLVVVNPGIHISTPLAYSMVIPRQPKHDLKKSVMRPLKEWKKLLVNDFEEPVIRKFPEIGNIREKLYKYGAIYSSMSGSGSTVYGIFEKPVDLRSSFGRCGYWSGSFLF